VKLLIRGIKYPWANLGKRKKNLKNAKEKAPWQ
jgi:hypothetical protein